MTNFVLLRQQMIANDMQQKDLAEAAGLSQVMGLFALAPCVGLTT